MNDRYEHVCKDINCNDTKVTCYVITYDVEIQNMKKDNDAITMK